MTYPYSEAALEHLHPVGWFEIPARTLQARDLVPTQAALAIERLVHHLADGEPEAGDPCAHVVAHDGTYYVHDGHHRWAIAYARDGVLAARVVDQDGRHVA